MLKILRLITDSNPESGGPIEGARLFGVACAALGHRQDILTLDAPGDRMLADYPGKIIPLGEPHSASFLSRYRYAPKMVPWLRSHATEYDAILVSGLWRYLARGARVALTDAETPYYVLPHGMLDPYFRKVSRVKHALKQLSWLVAEGPLIAGARQVLFTSQEEMLLAQDAFWPYRARGTTIGYGTSEVIPYAKRQIDEFRAAIPGLKKRRYFLFLSRIHEKKGCDLLIDAFADVAGAWPDIDLVIAGPDQADLKKSLIEIAEHRGIADRVHFPGMLRGVHKLGAYRGSLAFVLPSHQENFGIVVAEALACGTPVLISNKVNIWREVLAHGAGIVANDDLNGVRSMLESFLILSEKEVDKMGQAARTCFSAHFDADTAANNLIELISLDVKKRAASSC